MPTPPVIELACVCQMQTAHTSRLNTLPIMVNAAIWTPNILLLIPRTKMGIQAMGEITMLGLHSNVKFLEDEAVINSGSLYLEVSDMTLDWSNGMPHIRFIHPADLS